MADYDVAGALHRIENELIASMMRNLERHTAEEDDLEINWEQWQVRQLKALDDYKKRNRKIYGIQFKDINRQIENLIEMQRETGNGEQEIKILNAIKNGAALKKATGRSAEASAAFFRTNDRRLNALIDATTNDLQKAEHAMLRMADDKYRKIIFDAQFYAASGAGTYEKAIDMATKDFLRAGINCIEYKNGARHTAADYAEMAIRTAGKRSKLMGEGEMRNEYGIHTVIMNKRGNPCPKCLPFVGKVLIDDVWSGGSAKDGKYPLMSSAIAAGLYHPRCKDGHTTYFPDIDEEPDDKFTKQELQDIEEQNRKEAKQQYAERQAESYGRLAEYSLDEENRKRYGNRRNEWKLLQDKTKNTEVIVNNSNNGIIKLSINLFDKSDPLYVDSFSVEEIPGFKDVCLHGSSGSVQMRIDGKLKNMSAKEFADYLRSSTEYKGGDIRLASCSTGAGDNSFAQQLSKELGVRVMAPDDDLYYAPDEGTVFVGAPNHNVGVWRIFENGVEQ